MATPPHGERVRQLELALQELSGTVRFLQAQALDADRAQEASRVTLASFDKENALLRQRLDDLARRLDDQAAHLKVWDQRWWGLVAAVIVALVTAFLKK